MAKKEYKEFEVNHTYLVRYGWTDTVHSVTILLASKEAYHIRYNNGIDSNDIWELKDKFHYKYNIVEDITELVEPKLVKQGEMAKPIVLSTTILTKCHICHGMGTVPEPKSTAGSKTCPLCNGAKMIPEKFELTQEDLNQEK